MNGTMKFLLIAIIVAVVISLIFALNIYKKRTVEPSVLCGGIIDNSYDAPKEISSKDLVAVETGFFLSGKIRKPRYGSSQH